MGTKAYVVFFSFHVSICHSNDKNISRIAHSYHKKFTRKSTLEYKLDYDEHRYMSPERLNGEHYSYTSDVWSLGILVLTLMIGKLPFKDSALMFSFELIKAVSKGIEAWDLPDNLMTGRTLLQDFVSKCIAINPDERSTAEELLKHPWIVSHRVGQKGLRDMLHKALESEWKLEDSPQRRSAKRQAAERYSIQVAKHIVKEYVVLERSVGA